MEKYDIVLKEKEFVKGLNKDDIINLFNMLNSTEAYPIELEARIQESTAMGFISPKAAGLLDYDYETSKLHDYIANILDDMDNENDACEYDFKGIKIYLSR